MFARLQTTRTVPPADLAARTDEFLDVVAGHPGFAGAWLQTPIAASGGAFLTLWRTERDAELAPERTAAVRGPRPVTLVQDLVYRVVADLPGVAADETPAFAQITSFDAPRSAEWSEAILRAGRERIWPAVRDVPGTVRSLPLVGAGNAYVVVSLATGVEAIEDAQRRIMSTELLPWEDPAMLSGPDRIDLHRVAAFRSAATTTASTASTATI